MNELWLYGLIGDDEAGCGVNAVRQFLDDNPSGDFRLRIHSVGGDVMTGVAIYNLLRAAEASGRRIEVMIDGLAASMASEIAMVGTTISIGPAGMIMIHNPSSICIGGAREMREQAAALDVVAKQAISIYSARSKQTPEAVASMMDATTWMDAEKALELGFVDSISDPVDATMQAKKPVVPIDVTLMSGLKNVPVDHPDIILVNPVQMMADAKNPPPAKAGDSKVPDTTTGGGDASKDGKAVDTTASTLPTMTAAQVAANTDRCNKINMIAEKFGDKVENIADLKNKAIAEMTAADTFMSMCFEAEMKADKDDQDAGRGPSPLLPRIQFAPGDHLSPLDRVHEDRGIAMSMMARYRNGMMKADEVGERYRPYMQDKVVDVARFCLSNHPMVDKRQLAKMTSREVLKLAVVMRGMHTTSDFPEHLARGFQRVHDDGYLKAASRTNFQFWTGEKEVRDFREVNIVSASALSGFKTIPEGSGFEQMTRDEYTSSVAIEKRGGDITFSLEAIENDDLGFLTDVPFRMGIAARLDDQKLAERALIRGFRKDGKTGVSATIFTVENLTLMPEDHDLNVEALEIITDLLGAQEEPAARKLREAGEGDDVMFLNYGLKQLLTGRGLRGIGSRLSKENAYLPTEFGKDNPFAGTFEHYVLNYVDPLDYFGQDNIDLGACVTMVNQRGHREAEIYPIDVPDRLAVRWGVLKRRGAAIINERGIVKGHQERPTNYGQEAAADAGTGN